MRKGQAAARRDARRHHLQRFISASEKGKQPERALEVFEAMLPTVHVRRASSGRKPLDLAGESIVAVLVLFLFLLVRLEFVSNFSW